ncbi:MAG: Na+/H+ antiporter subunit E [Halofilum sp. (in: g-proteobacteria)]
MKKIGIPALGLFVLWLLLSGHYTGLVTTFGVLSSLGVCLLANRLGVLEPDGRSFAFMGRLLLYIPWLVKEMIKSNIVVAKVVWHPSMPIRPQIARGRATQRTDLGLAAYANSITLTPGTLTIAADEPGVVIAHGLTDETADGVRDGEMDRRVTALEGNGVTAAEGCT